MKQIIVLVGLIILGVALYTFITGDLQTAAEGLLSAAKDKFADLVS